MTVSEICPNITSPLQPVFVSVFGGIGKLQGGEFHGEGIIGVIEEHGVVVFPVGCFSDSSGGLPNRGEGQRGNVRVILE